MSERFDNRQIISDYLHAGGKGAALGNVGVEIEQFLLDEDGERVKYREKHGRLDVETILERLAEYYPKVSRTSEGAIMGLSRPSASITIEPAAQIEISIAPFSSIAEVQAEYEHFAFRLGQIIKPEGYSLVPYGYDPSGKALDCQLIPKPRYGYMDNYLRSLPGMTAERMMRASASLQVSLDFADEADAVRKTRIATLLGPVFAFLADNTPVFEGRPNTEPIARLRLWRKVDPARCQVIPHLFAEDFGFDRYADWILDTPPIFITRPDEHFTGATPARELYADAPMGVDDVEHVLGMFWPDVRLKHYVEIRQADALPLEPMLGYVALIKGLFYSETNLAILEHAFGVEPGSTGAWPYTAQSVEDAIEAVVADDWDAVIYGKTVAQWADLLFQLAPDGLGTEASYLDALKDFRGL